ncbi:toxic anion resistance protein [Vibrio sp. SCSIO 43136]|uniref:toxic anion resistance protein n=1 Tax=Vibrio sp. SCSIO 43136 TaxID=2819101 RepID=UPI002075473C|nr:toxic anion resistance protein [Vibrio sp. SCSIO 43136]USD65682.1 toxic anion resistance protein [Vibrio sp. SCSIO 43136]
MEKSEVLVTEATTEQPSEHVVAIAERFDPFDSVATITFGKEALEKITQFSDNILEQVKVREAGEAGQTLQQMISEMDSTQLDQLGQQSFLAKMPLFGELFDSVKKFTQSFDSVKQRLEELALNLEGQEHKLAHDIQQLDGLYEHNLELLKGLEQYIEAGRYKLSLLNEQTLPELLAQAQSSGDPLDAQKHRDATQVIARLEKRVHNLELTRLAAIQTAPQIRLSQEGNKMLMEDIQDIVHNTLPLWKRQFLIAISNHKKEKALNVTRAVKDYTNKQYLKNAENLKQLEEQIAENYQRGILDIECLEAVNRLTIETLNNTLSRVKEGRAQREQAQRVIEKAEQELKVALQRSIDDQ